MNVIKVTFTFKVQRASAETSEKFNQPLGVIEVIDADGFRQGFAKTEEEAVQLAKEAFDDLGIYNFDVSQSDE